MQSAKKELILNFNQKLFLVVFLALIISFFLFFKNLFFQPILLLKSFGELSLDPEIAFANEKPTFLEFYAEWCEVCKDMAPKLAEIREEYKKDINFVFLNVDNPKWENYIRKFEVNGIPQLNLFDSNNNLITTFIGRHEENKIRESIENINREINSNKKVFNSDFSTFKADKNSQITARSHG